MRRTEWIDRHRGTLGAPVIETCDAEHQAAREAELLRSGHYLVPWDMADTLQDCHLRQLFLAEAPHA